ncbi:mannose-ethanolamine phosphotransferase gpi13 [Tulasnella sp. 424]|nr:mannose-ethanolamine phosphotransferase gpi13 [Tulasnella sp. 424]KAG8969642.1 mannose-ethanolamine phosphotransferase gpi13 [Tulasnella sp. 425]
MPTLRQRIRSLAPAGLITWVLVWIFTLHATSLYLFTRGFLLSRLALSDKAICTPSGSCSIPSTHSKAILIIIDALRFDFIAPTSFHPSDENHHGILTLPAELTAQNPDRSFIFNAHSDPPTATLQRIKGITTGSLPTFIDIGSNFGASEIAEDSLIHQLTAAGKRVAFMGDDTWTGVYPSSFHPNMTWPYDSFNVEDLHSVDEGVIRHIFPLVRDGGWDFAIGHFLGVDHVGHRVGPSGDAMRAKLKQMDGVLRRLTEEIDDDTLLVVLGDHGMDLKGDHGGDGIFETSSAMWIYSKSVPLATRPLPQDALPSHGTSAANLDADASDVAWKTFPGATSPSRAVQQIDILPTISLLLGLPIPFNNLGMVIPELFLRDSATNDLILNEAMKLNADQIQAYLAAYRASPSGGELDEAWSRLNRLHDLATKPTTSLQSKRNFIRQSLRSCRELWAQFNVVLMVAGLVALGLTVPVVWSIYRAVDQGQTSSWDAVSEEVLHRGTVGAAVGGALGLVVKIAGRPVMGSFSLLQATLLGAVLGSELNVLSSRTGTTLFALPKNFFQRQTALPVLILILHALSYTSNSFLMWEDRLTQYFLFTMLFTSVVISAPTAPTHRLRIRIFGFSLATAILLRLIAVSTVCREEQQPYCRVTFYSSSTTPVAPYLTMFGAPIATFALPYAIQYLFLSTSRADEAPVTTLFLRIWRWLLLAGSTYWIFERLENWNGLNPDRIPLVQTVRTYLARSVLGCIVVVLGAFWWYAPLSILVREQTPEDGAQGGKKRVAVIGFANAYGSSYLLFLLVPFALVFATAQPTGQVVLALGLIAITSYLEVVDGQSDADGMVEAFTSMSVTSSAPQLQVAYQKPTFAVPTFISILSLLLFYSTGHQATMPSIQWKSAFIGFPTLTYPFAPILVVLNTFGPIALATLAAPLFALWNIDPPKPNSPDNQGESTTSGSRSPSSLVLNRTLKLTLGTSLYHSALTFGTAFGAAALRRHLMVWKVFAPRFMLGGASLLIVDLALVLGVGVGVSRVVWKVEKTFGAGRAKQQ